MAVKFPLEVKNGVKARNILELKENFDIEKVVAYFLDGKLKNWLDARYYEEEAEAVKQLDGSDPELAKKLCKIFDAEYEKKAVMDTEEIARRNERIAKLKQFTDDEEIINNIDSVAFDQEELADLYDKGIEKIYLCEGNFNIPKAKQNIDYILVGNVVANGIIQKESVKTSVDHVCLKCDETFEDANAESHEININRSLKKEINKISNKLNFIEQKAKEGNQIYFDTYWDSSYRFVFRSDANKAAKNRIERMASEYKEAIEEYAETIADNYLDEIISNINQYISKVRALLLKYNRVVDGIKVTISLNKDNAIGITLTDTFLSQDTQAKIHKHINDICASESRKLSSCPLIFITIDDMEVYDGESIFGRSKFVKMYNYKIDNLDEISKKLQNSQVKLANVIYSKQVLNAIYKKLTTTLENTILKQ